MPRLTEKAIENWPAIRTVHLFGGCRVFCGLEPRFEITPKAVSGKLLHGELSNYRTLYSVLESSNLTIIGVEFFYDNRQAEGRLPAEWRVYHRRSKTAWLCEEVTQKWGDVGKSAYDSKMGRLWDVSRRISHQLRVCGWRIREISEAYNRQLTAEALNEKGFEAAREFDNAFVWQSYVAIHSFLVDSCILRDYLAEFAAHFIYGPQLRLASVDVTTASGLKKLLSKITDADGLTASLRSAMKDKGWLHELGTYRDLVMHLAPLARAASRLFARNGILPIAQSEGLSYTLCPIPEDPEKIMAVRARGDFFEDFDAQVKTYTGTNKTGAPYKDALAYCHISLEKLTELAESLTDYSPLTPQRMLFELDNDVEPATVKFVE